MILFGVRLEQSQLLPSTYYGESAGVTVYASKREQLAVEIGTTAGELKLFGSGENLDEVRCKMRERLEAYERECAALRRILEARP